MVACSVLDERTHPSDWNSGLAHFWGLPSGRWRSSKRGEDTQRAVIVERGWVRDVDGVEDEESDVELLTGDGVLNASGAAYGHGEHVGVLVDMDDGW